MAVRLQNISLQVLFNNNINDASPRDNQIAPSLGGVTFDTNNRIEGLASTLYDGSGGHLIMPADEAFNFGSGTFTIEFSLYSTNNTLRFQSVISTNSDTYIDGSVFFQKRTNGTITIGGRDFTERPNSSGLLLDRWYDVCITRTIDNTIYFLVRDKVTDIATITSHPNMNFIINLNGENGVSLGRSIWDGDDGVLNGNLDAMRVVKGESVFDGLTNAERMAYRNFYTQPDSQLTSVSGTVTLDGQPYESKVVAVRYASNVDNTTIFGSTISDSTTGNYTITGLGLNTVMVFTVQDYGIPWPSVTPLSLGDVVHPTVPNGYVFRVTAVGTTGGTEPAWPVTPNTDVTDGGVTYTSEILLQPEIQGYIQTAEVI